jgi:hypothetical protein
MKQLSVTPSADFISTLNSYKSERKMTDHPDTGTVIGNIYMKTHSARAINGHCEEYVRQCEHEINRFCDIEHPKREDIRNWRLENGLAKGQLYDTSIRKLSRQFNAKTSFKETPRAEKGNPVEEQRVLRDQVAKNCENVLEGKVWDKEFGCYVIASSSDNYLHTVKEEEGDFETEDENSPKESINMKGNTQVVTRDATTNRVEKKG